jgi:hypothetical protein
MNHTSTIAALREIADTLEDRYPGEGGRPAAALRIRDIATTLERQGGALDLAALAERLEAAAAAINAAAERLEALTVAPPDLDVAGLGTELTDAVRRILTDDYREIIARGDRTERVAAVARAKVAGYREIGGVWHPPGEGAPIVSRTTERHVVHADGSETHEHYVDDGSDRAVHFAAVSDVSDEIPATPQAWPDPMAGGDDVPPRWSPLGAAALAVPVPPAPSALHALADSRRPFRGEDLGVGPGDFVATHLGPPLPAVTLYGPLTAMPAGEQGGAGPRDDDAILACAQGCGSTPHRFRPSPEAGPHWRCSECGDITPALKVRTIGGMTDQRALIAERFGE